MSTRRPKIVDPPKALKPEAAKRWRAVYAQVAAHGPVDVELLTGYCLVWARWRQAEFTVAQAGPLTKAPNGRIVANPMVAVANQTATHVRELEARLGLTAPAGEPHTQHPAPDDEAERPVTRKVLAARLNVHMQTITVWERQGLPIYERGRRGRPSTYLESQVRAWQAAREQAAKANGHVDVAQERARKERAQAVLAEQTFQARSRQLLPADEVERRWTAEVQATRTKILATYTTQADRVHRAAILEGVPGVERVLKAIAYELLRELSSTDEAPVDDEEGVTSS